MFRRSRKNMGAHQATQLIYKADMEAYERIYKRFFKHGRIKHVGPRFKL